MAVDLIRTDSTHPDFVALVQLLDRELAERDGAEHGYYAQFNKIAAIRHVVVAYEAGQAVSCGAIKALGPDEAHAIEVKRMFTRPEARGRQLAAAVLAELESWARELGYARTILETGKRQPEAIRLYERSGYRLTPNYGQYVGVDNSVCFAKEL